MITIHEGPCFVWSEKKIFFEAPCSEKRLRIRAQLKFFPVRLTMAELQQAEVKVQDVVWFPDPSYVGGAKAGREGRVW